MARSRRRSWRQRLFLVAGGAFVLVLLAGAAATGYAAWILNRIERVDVGLDAPGSGDQISSQDIRVPDDGASGTEATLPPLGPAGPPENFLIVGSDNAEGIDPDDPILSNRQEEAGNFLADTIIVLRIDPATTTATLVSIPRDLWVEIAGAGFEQKINAAFNDPDAQSLSERADRLIATIRESLDVPIHHFVHVNWAGFRGLVSELGGIDVCFPQPTRDVNTGLLVEEPGLVELGPDQALAYVRSRKLQVQDEDGNWVAGDTQSDLDRIRRQQEFIRDALDQTLELRNPNRIRGVIEAAVDNVQIDQALGLGDIVDLARRFSDFTGEQLRTFDLPVAGITIPARGSTPQLSALELLPAAEVTLDVLRGIEPGDVVPGRVQVHLTGPSDLTTEVSAALGDAGFLLAGAEFAAAAPETVIRYGPGGQEAALLLAAWLEAPVAYEASEVLTGNQLELVIGEDFPGVRAGAPRQVGPTEEPPVVTAPPEEDPAVTTEPTTTESTPEAAVPAVCR
jgi:polyisoprenyl-teichoic acid--peptidoglycan teichoic acid transferase